MDDLERLLDGFDPLPHGSMVTGVMRLVNYLTPDGEREFRFKYDGEESVSETVGTLFRMAVTYCLDDDDG